jgi:hypothetical protein
MYFHFVILILPCSVCRGLYLYIYLQCICLFTKKIFYLQYIFAFYREINQIYTNSAKLDDVYPHSECRCPETHPKINTTESYYSLQCENENGGLTNRFKTDSVVEYIIDNNKNTGWKTSQENVMLTIQLEAKYQVNILSHIVLFYDLIFLLLFTVHYPHKEVNLHLILITVMVW